MVEHKPACGTCNGACPCEAKKNITVIEHKPACGTCNGACPCIKPKIILPERLACGCKVCPCTSESAPTHTLHDVLNASNPPECGTCGGACPCEKPKMPPPVPKCGTCNGDCPCPSTTVVQSGCGCSVCPCEEKPKPPPPCRNVAPVTVCVLARMRKSKWTW